jgi:U2 small nuclear ribonucleoprotein A'
MIKLDHHLSMLENLDATRDSFDAIDLSHNDLERLDSFPLLQRLTSLNASHNKLCFLQEDFASQLPALSILCLSNNLFSDVEQLKPLFSCKQLRVLVLAGNPLTKQDQYRLQVIQAIPSLRILDYSYVKPGERKEAKKLFGKKKSTTSRKRDQPEADSHSQQVGQSNGSSSHTTHGKLPSRLSEAQMERILAAIERASSVEKVQRLESYLSRGVMPPESELS